MKVWKAVGPRPLTPRKRRKMAAMRSTSTGRQTARCTGGSPHFRAWGDRHPAPMFPPDSWETESQNRRQHEETKTKQKSFIQVINQGTLCSLVISFQNKIRKTKKTVSLFCYSVSKPKRNNRISKNQKMGGFHFHCFVSVDLKCCWDIREQFDFTWK